MNHAGVLRLSGGASTAAEITLTESDLILTAGATDLGEWPLAVCSCRRRSLGEFELDLNGEVAGFLPDDPDAFGAVIAQRFRHIRLADRVDAVRADTSAAKEAQGGPDSGRWGMRSVGFGVLAAGVGGLVIFLSVLIVGGTNEVTVPTVASVTTTTILEIDSVFDLTPTQFSEQWNLTSARLNADLPVRGRLGPGSFESVLLEALTLQGTVDDEGTLSRIVVAGDPAADSDESIIAAWGVAIAVAEPDLSGEGRRDLLVRLGFDLSRRDLSNLDGEVEQAGIRYSLRYLPAFSSVIFTLAEM